VREFSSVPIVLVTALNAERDIVLGLDAGADDYLTKPFGAPELLARVRAVLRRSRHTGWPAAGRHATHRCGELEIDFSQHQVTVRGKPVPVTPTEYRILSQLAQHAGRVLTHEELLSRVWGAAYKDETHLLRVNMSRLRDKIEPDRAQPRYILSRPGLGYLLAVD
jgi:two-component system KDP operon response regulator KdpE